MAAAAISLGQHDVIHASLLLSVSNVVWHTQTNKHKHSASALLREDSITGSRVSSLLRTPECTHATSWFSLLEDMAICMSKCASNVVNGTGVKSGVSWMPDGVSLIHLIHQE